MPHPVLLLTVLAVTATVLLILFEISAVILTKWLTTYEASYDCDSRLLLYCCDSQTYLYSTWSKCRSLFKHGAFVADFCVFIL